MVNRVYVLEWVWSDGYDNGNGVISVYATLKGAEAEGKKFIELQDDENYSIAISEYGVRD